MYSMQAGGDDRRMEVRRLRTPAESRALSDSGEYDTAEESRKSTGDSAGGNLFLKQELNHEVDAARTESKSQFRNPKSQILKCSSLSLRVFEAGIMVSFSDSLSAGGKVFTDKYFTFLTVDPFHTFLRYLHFILH